MIYYTICTVIPCASSRARYIEKDKSLIQLVILLRTSSRKKEMFFNRHDKSFEVVFNLLWLASMCKHDMRYFAFRYIFLHFDYFYLLKTYDLPRLRIRNSTCLCQYHPFSVLQKYNTNVFLVQEEGRETCTHLHLASIYSYINAKIDTICSGMHCARITFRDSSIVPN